jgi:predicted transcriptional regulator
MPELLLYIRRELLMSQAELARQIKVNQSCISRCEAGDVLLSMKSFKKVLDYAKKNKVNLSHIKIIWSK